MPVGMQAFLEREGAARADGTREEPALDKFEAEIARHKATQEEVQVSSTIRPTGVMPHTSTLACSTRLACIAHWAYPSACQ